jgi:ParB/RepB/Spo0J family partition protein
MKEKLREKSRQKLGISVSPEYSEIVPKLSDVEYEALKQSIKDDGQQMPIIVNEQRVILDGHHRYKACRELGLEPKTAIVTFKTKDEERLFVINTNLNRRQLSLYQRAALALKKKPVLAKLAKENMRQVKVSRIRETLHVDDTLAKDAGVSKEVLYRVERIEKEGSEELKELARGGKLSINRAYALIGKDIDSVMAIEKIQKSIDLIAEAFSRIPRGSEQEQAAKRYMENFAQAVNSISAQDLENRNALKILLSALYGVETALLRHISLP